MITDIRLLSDVNSIKHKTSYKTSCPELNVDRLGGGKGRRGERVKKQKRTGAFFSNGHTFT